MFYPRNAVFYNLENIICFHILGENAPELCDPFWGPSDPSDLEASLVLPELVAMCAARLSTVVRQKRHNVREVALTPQLIFRGWGS